MANLKKPPLLPRKVAAAQLGFQTQTLAAWAHRGKPKLPFVKLGGRTFYEQENLDKLVRDHTR